MSLKLSISTCTERLRHGYRRFPDVLTHTEKAVRNIPDMPAVALDTEEDRHSFLQRVQQAALSALRPSDMRRLLHTVWEDDFAPASLVQRALGEAIERQRRSFDQCIIRAYLSYFPVSHPVFDVLVKTVDIVAQRWDWPWRDRGAHLALWQPAEGPKRLGAGLLSYQGNAPEYLQSCGLGADAIEFMFVKACIREACLIAADSPAASAEKNGLKLISLAMPSAGAGALDPHVVYGLLKPWLRHQPSDKYKRKLISFLSQHVGDPRLERARWDYLRTQLASSISVQESAAMVDMFRRWVVQEAVYQFFDIVARTTGNAAQWRARTDFWLEYMRKGHINDAWFVFGPAAENAARQITGIDTELRYGRFWGGSTDAEHSALLLSIGDLRIAEWSHNGACRFWSAMDVRAPAQYQPHYDTGDIKAMSGGKGFERYSHQGEWQKKFARLIYDRTRLEHPKHGRGSMW